MKFVLGVITIAGVTSTAAGQPVFQGLGRALNAGQLSRDGSTVLGTVGNPPRPIRFTIEKAGPVAHDISLPAGVVRPATRAISEDGSHALFMDGQQPHLPYRWRDDGSAEGESEIMPIPKGATSFFANAMGPDGACYGYAIYGPLLTRMVRWTAWGPPEVLPLPPGYSAASGSLCDDASLAYGLATNDGLTYSLCRATTSSAEILAPFPSNRLEGVSLDGSTVIGSRSSGPNWIVFRWTAGEGYQDILSFNVFTEGQLFLSDISADGSLLFGLVAGQASTVPLVWERGVGRMGVETFLTSRGVPLSGWRELNIVKSSRDGRRFLVGGINPAGVYEWAVVSVPTPCSADFNRDGVLNSQDYFDFLMAFFGALPEADINADGAVGPEDFFEFAGLFGEGCA